MYGSNSCTDRCEQLRPQLFEKRFIQIVKKLETTSETTLTSFHRVVKNQRPTSCPRNRRQNTNEKIRPLYSPSPTQTTLPNDMAVNPITCGTTEDPPTQRHGCQSDHMRDTEDHCCSDPTTFFPQQQNRRQPRRTGQHTRPEPAPPSGLGRK